LLLLPPPPLVSTYILVYNLNKIASDVISDIAHRLYMDILYFKILYHA